MPVLRDRRAENPLEIAFLALAVVGEAVTVERESGKAHRVQARLARRSRIASNDAGNCHSPSRPRTPPALHRSDFECR